MEKFPIEFKRGESFSFVIAYVNNDGTIFSESTSTVTCQFTIKQSYDDSSPAISLSKGTGWGAVEYNASTGEFTVRIPSSSTSGLTWTKGVYDMWINSNTNGKDYVLDGTVTVLPNVG